MKSIHFAPVPAMRGKLTMRFTDVVAQNFKPKVLAEIHRREMLFGESDFDSIEDPDLDCDTGPPSWCCDQCDWDDFIGQQTPHHHAYD